jgi:hypothetical protein
LTQHKLTKLAGFVFVLLLGIYLVLAYFLVPALWAHFEHQPGLANLPMVTTTKQGIPGDPINIGLVGSADEIKTAMAAAGWFSADRVSARTSLEIAGSVMLRRSYIHAPVSTLIYEGRAQDMAFEKPAGRDAAQRHHVRFWKVLDKGEEGRPVWLGAATFDQGVGFSHLTGQITHHISGDVDGERNKLVDDLVKAQRVTTLYQVSGVGPTIGAENGGGDRYYSDGEIRVAVIAPSAAFQGAPPQELQPSALVSYKDMIWAAVTGKQAP